MSNLGEWIREKWKTQAKFGAKIGIAQGRISKWVLGTEGITEDFQAKIRKLGYTGPWPREEAQEAPADFTSREDHWKLVGRVETLERRLEEAFVLIRDLKLKGP